MAIPSKSPGRFESVRGLLLPLACLALGILLAMHIPEPAPEPFPPPTAAVSAALPTPAPPAAIAAAAQPHAATYRGDMGLTGVFDSVCPAAPVAVRWRYATTGTPAGGVVWDGARFLVALAEGTVLALDPAGHELWRRGAALDGIAAPPLTDGTRCFVISPTGTLAAFRTTDGELLWRATAPVDFAARSAPILAPDGLVAISQRDGTLLSFAPADGAVHWTGVPIARCDGPVSVESNTLFFGHCDAAVQFHATGTGRFRGSVPLGDESQVAGAVAVRGARAACGTQDGDVVMLDTIRQSVLWRSPTGDGEVFSAPVLTDDLVVITTASAEAIAFAAADGRERWRHRTGVQSATSPILVGGRVVLAAAGTVMALDAASGSLLWQLPVGDATTEPCAGAGLVVVGTDEGDIVAVGSRD